MSWQKNIKMLFYTSKMLAIFICYAVVSNGFGNMTPGYLDFLVVFLIMILMQYLDGKTGNRYLIILAPLFMNFLLFFIIYGKQDFIPYASLGILVTLILPRYDLERISYSYIADKLKHSFITLVLSVVLYLKVDRIYGTTLLRYYIFFIVLSVITLREARKFEYKIQRKKSDDLVNTSILISVLLLSTNFIYNIFKTILSTLLKVISFIMDKIIYAILYLLGAPINAFINFIQDLLTRNNSNANMSLVEQKDQLQDLKNLQNEQQLFWSILENVIKIAIVLLVVYLIYSTIKKYRHGKVIKDEGVIEVREKIDRKRVSTKKSLAIRMKELLKRKTLNEKIFYIFRDFQDRTFKKGWFKPYMTSKQLYNVTRIHIEEDEKVRYITQLYNEAKFSNHSIKENEVNEYKKCYNEIKDKINRS
ncbi:hypothetical protein KQI89_12455 [Clostridium sp. MSJ-4]|uniref:DUF4129 domain-containing protein n=1 Tax=Clostridium simiarum TaxID=2841506 RepID=A0ABS6F4P0_9CLOT|nr:hypothetical protein [Clostridium simiarum]MBU5592568.1 hypothetical protein [Clostridium simiarum]